MRAIRTRSSNGNLKLGETGPEHDLPIRRGPSAGPDGLVPAGDPCYHLPYISTVWQPTHEERAHLAIGRNIELVLITGASVPPLAIGVSDEEPIDTDAAHAQPPLEEPAIWMAMSVPLADDLVTVIELIQARAREARERGDELDARTAGALERLLPFGERLGVYTAELKRESEARDA